MESFLSFSRWVDHATAGLKRGKKTPREGFLCPTPDSDSFSDAQFGKNLGALSRQFPASANRRFQFEKRFISLRNETLSVVAMCACNEDCYRVVGSSVHRNSNGSGGDPVSDDNKLARARFLGCWHIEMSRYETVEC